MYEGLPPHCLSPRSGQLVGTGVGTLFPLARTVAFRNAGASSLGWWAGRALGMVPGSGRAQGRAAGWGPLAPKPPTQHPEAQTSLRWEST